MVILNLRLWMPLPKRIGPKLRPSGRQLGDIESCETSNARAYLACYTWNLIVFPFVSPPGMRGRSFVLQFP